jgi:hypothetical protein
MSTVPFKRQHMAQTFDYYARAREGLVLVADSGDKIDGVLIATCEPYFFNAKKQFATDIMFVSSGHGVKMLRMFKEWAKAMGADRIIMGVSSEDPRADAFLEVSGFNTTGAMYVFRC